MASNEKDPKVDPAKQGTGSKDLNPGKEAVGVAKPVVLAKDALDQARVLLAKADADFRAAVQQAPTETSKTGAVLGSATTKAAPIEKAQQVLINARKVVDGAKQTYHEARVHDLPESPEEEFRRLDSGVPIVMLPVRVETRFARDRAQLLVRVYPDEIFADGHEPELTSSELSAGLKFWGVIQTGTPAMDAWRALIQQFPSPRAAWIAKVTDPAAVGAGAIPTRAWSWSRAIEAKALPDRWILVLDVGGERRGPFVFPPIRLPLALGCSSI